MELLRSAFHVSSTAPPICFLGHNPVPYLLPNFTETGDWGGRSNLVDVLGLEVQLYSLLPLSIPESHYGYAVVVPVRALGGEHGPTLCPPNPHRYDPGNRYSGFRVGRRVRDWCVRGFASISQPGTGALPNLHTVKTLALRMTTLCTPWKWHNNAPSGHDSGTNTPKRTNRLLATGVTRVLRDAT